MTLTVLLALQGKCVWFIFDTV